MISECRVHRIPPLSQAPARTLHYSAISPLKPEIKARSRVWKMMRDASTSTSTTAIVDATVAMSARRSAPLHATGRS
ncbi:hypothetical protein M758_7G015400 [Ceratodon purpureus]|uniref:Uncharacterized protein n=1 Tax=Ceratodon purpureus TaxID=3225 RepID=A0A8T0H1Q2_CERPU|nr:hypothetical protein KC19_7G015400 [Ceratodon purpureus]KAG0609806.1 hypothetical protein M758_7G015400 [Ceratodon purpureus]